MTVLDMTMRVGNIQANPWVRRENGQRILLTAGHPEKPDHTHPIFSPDSKQVLIRSGVLNGGKSLDLMTVAVP